MTKSFLIGLGLCGALALSAPEAMACGGCFAPPAESTIVTGHRMAFAVSPTRTVLWDQFQYSGSPDDFSWVLPVRPGAYIEASSDAWFDALDTVTLTRVSAPQLRCANPDNGGCGCGAMAASDRAATGSSFGEPGVVVLHQGSVGPYETVTLRSTDADALRTWLTGHNYAIPAEIEPVINAYVAESFDFIALRLSPGNGIQQMTPVRVVTPGGDYALPLRMVAAGAGEFVAITLFVIAEGRYAMPDLPESRVASSDLVWDFSRNQSNYLALRDAALGTNGGETYLTTYAKPGTFHTTATGPNGLVFYQTTGGTFANTFLDVYLAEADAAAGSCAGSVSLFDSDAEVVQACAPDDPNACDPVPEGALDSRFFECGEATDLAAAMIGMRPANVWVTRLEMNLPYSALDADCIVEPAVDEGPVDNLLQAEQYENPPCAEPLFSSSLPPPSPYTPLLLMGSAGALWFARRRLRSPRRVALAV